MEPWYEMEEITPKEVELVIHQGWFHRELFGHRNSSASDENLRNLLYEDNRQLSPPYRHVTFEAIRQEPNFDQHAKQILSEEIKKIGSFGSHRGFYTFCREPLMRAYAKGVVRECWAKPVLAKFVRRWLEHYYAYGSSGFLRAKANFDFISLR